MTVLRREPSQSQIASPEASFLSHSGAADTPNRACAHPSPSITGHGHGVFTLMPTLRNELHGCRGEAPAGVQGQRPCPCGAPPGGALDMRGVSRTLLGGSLLGRAGLYVAGRDVDASAQPPARFQSAVVTACPQECSGRGARAGGVRRGVHLAGLLCVRRPRAAWWPR